MIHHQSPMVHDLINCAYVIRALIKFPKLRGFRELQGWRIRMDPCDQRLAHLELRRTEAPVFKNTADLTPCIFIPLRSCHKLESNLESKMVFLSTMSVSSTLIQSVRGHGTYSVYRQLARSTGNNLDLLLIGM